MKSIAKLWGTYYSLALIVSLSDKLNVTSDLGPYGLADTDTGDFTHLSTDIKLITGESFSARAFVNTCNVPTYVTEYSAFKEHWKNCHNRPNLISNYIGD